MSVQVKICGVRRIEDALCAAEAGADMIGLNFWPGTPRCVTLEQAREITDAVAGRIKIVAVFVDAPRGEILATADAVGADYVQLHGSESPEFVRDLGPRPIIKAFRVRSEEDLAGMSDFAAAVYLLDARVPGMKGGTGRTIDWELARRAAESRPVLLAGGLTPRNVAEAVRTARPWGVDTASGVEVEPGVKDPEKIRCFVRNAKAEEEERP